MESLAARRAAALTYRKRTETTRVILHDSHTVPDRLNMEAWLRVNARKLGLLDIGYHYVIFPDGKLLETRPHDTQGSANTGMHNLDSIQVCLIGGRRIIPGPDGEEILVPCDTFTPEQRETFKWLYHQFLTPVYGLLPLSGHSELGRHKGLCPALNMEQFRQWLNAQS